MTQFIIGIVANILGHIAIEILERQFVRRIPDIGSAIVGFCGTSQLIVLRPEIALYDFGPCCEPEKIRVVFGKCATALLLRFGLA